VLQGIVLLNTGNYSLAEWDEKDEEWDYDNATIGDYYIVNDDRHLYAMQSDGWHDLGVFEGKDGTNGQNAVLASLANEHEDFLYNDAGKLIAPSSGATSQARLYDGNTDRT